MKILEIKFPGYLAERRDNLLQMIKEMFEGKDKEYESTEFAINLRRLEGDISKIEVCYVAEKTLLQKIYMQQKSVVDDKTLEKTGVEEILLKRIETICEIPEEYWFTQLERARKGFFLIKNGVC